MARGKARIANSEMSTGRNQLARGNERKRHEINLLEQKTTEINSPILVLEATLMSVVIGRDSICPEFPDPSSAMASWRSKGAQVPNPYCGLRYSRYLNFFSVVGNLGCE